jgi:hypothetical protein
MTICALCFSAFEARTSYGICPRCYSRDNLHAFDMLQSAIRRAERAHVLALLTLPELLGRISDFQGRCAFCGYHRFTEIALVDPAQGLVLSNVVPACHGCQIHLHESFEQALRRVRDFLAVEPGQAAMVFPLFEEDIPV